MRELLRFLVVTAGAVGLMVAAGVYFGTLGVVLVLPVAIMFVLGAFMSMRVVSDNDDSV